MTLAGAQSRIPDGVGPNGAPAEHPDLQVPDDPVYRAVVKLRRPGELLAEVGDAWAGRGDTAEQVRIVHTHYKPFHRARLVAEVIGRNGEQGVSVRQYLFIQVYGSPREARSRLDAAGKKDALTCTGPPVFLLAGVDAVAWSLPNSPRLRAAQIGFLPAKFGKFMRRGKTRRQLLRRGVDPLTLPQYPQEKSAPRGTT